MKINLEIRSKTTSGRHETWTKTVDRPYACAPRAGEWVEIDERGYGGKHKVASVAWENDGSVTLRMEHVFHIDDEADSEPRQHLVDAGFTSTLDKQRDAGRVELGPAIDG